MSDTKKKFNFWRFIPYCFASFVGFGFGFKFEFDLFIFLLILYDSSICICLDISGGCRTRYSLVLKIKLFLKKRKKWLPTMKQDMQYVAGS